MKNEMICIRRQGFNFTHTVGVDLAAMVTHLRYARDSHVHTDEIIRQEWMIPRYGHWE